MTGFKLHKDKFLAYLIKDLSNSSIIDEGTLPGKIIACNNPVITFRRLTNFN